MKDNRIILEYPNARFRFRTGVSLHSHTLHSRESLDFINRFARRMPLVRMALERGEARYRSNYGAPLDLTRAWWTPPLTAYAAWRLEAEHIRRFDLEPLVSLSDHDDIDGPMNLQVLEECAGAPVSVEWTVPWENTFFHLGVHNLPVESARATMAALAAFTAGPSAPALRDLLSNLASHPAVLLVFNHPCWDETEIGAVAHLAAAGRFMEYAGEFIHAMEINGLRPWKENRSVIAFAKACDKPLISGGDRHAMEPNAVLNLTNARTFAEFVQEIREEGNSDVLVTFRYMEPFSLRILENLQQILANQEAHGLGWKRWSERVFYISEDGVTRSLAALWKQEPAAVRIFVSSVRLLRHRTLRGAFGLAFGGRGEMAL